MAGKKKKILLMSDDLRMHSGIATQSKEFVLGTIHHYDWIQLGGAINHPEEGKIIDMCEAVRQELGVNDGYLKIDNNDSSRVHCFVDKTTGDIYKPSNDKTPHTTGKNCVKGNIYNQSTYQKTDPRGSWLTS